MGAFASGLGKVAGEAMPMPMPMPIGGLTAPTGCEKYSAPAETRTPDPQIKSQLLYQLSYGGIRTSLP